MNDLVVVGVGGSAGGVQAMKQFFQRVPLDCGIAYVAILHLSPQHESHLAEVLQVSCPLPVKPVFEAIRVESDHVYVISPNQSLAMNDGTLSVSQIIRLEERRAPVDIFLRTLADSHASHAVGVLLSGTGADGSMGLKRIKERGGICLVQDPEEAEHGDMPRNGVATGLVDYVLPVADIPAKIAAYKRTLAHVRVAEDPTERAEAEERALRDVFAQLRARTGHDFADYKRSTMWRRLERRLAVHELSDVAGYAEYMRRHPEEAQALLRDLLISVTSFFRDRAAFATLQQEVIPKLFAHKTDEQQVRVWIVGCATGEEAYSVAMLLAEQDAGMPGVAGVQVFATDLDDAAIATAREGLYSVGDTAEISPERLRRFFVKEGDYYRVRRDLREMVLFARHNVIKDPPFSHLDLVSCRNLLIYLNRSAQHRVIDVLHFGLTPGGYLFVGSSESIDGTSNLFLPVDKDAKIFQSRQVPLRTLVPLAEWPTYDSRQPAGARPTSDEPGAGLSRERRAYADLHQRLLEEYAPPSLVVNEDYEILHLSDRAAAYLQFVGGEPSMNLLSAVRPELRLDLRAALYQASQNRTRVEAKNLQVRLERGLVAVDVVVRPVLRDADHARGFFLIVFYDRTPDPAAALEPTMAVVEPAQQLADEVARLRVQLRATVEQHEIQAEELKASNEELQAMNEELRSVAEELETSKEELQSVNEQLTTVNQELKIKIEEQSQVNNDIQNLINTSAIAAIFLDRQSRIKLYTPRARDMFNVIPTDRDRPLSDITSPLPRDVLQQAIDSVLERLEPAEREVRTPDGRWHMMTVMPYRTSDNRIDGVVVIFVDITQRKNDEEELRRSKERLRLVLESITDHAIITLDPHGGIEWWNVGAERMFGYTADEAIGQSTELIFTPEDRVRGVHVQELQTARADGRAAGERWHLRKDGTRFFVSGVLSPLGPGADSGFVKIARDLTARKQHEEALQRAHDELEARVNDRTRQLGASHAALESELRERREAEERVRKLLSRVITSQEDERRRIARDLHDDLGQKMTVLHLKLESLRRLHPEGSELQSQVKEAQAFVQQLDRDLDFFTWELRPAALYDLGLVPALRDYVLQWSRNFNIPAEFNVVGIGDERLRPDIEINMYRIAQEVLNNVYKHARATNVDVVLQRRGDRVVLSIEDDGIGFDVEAVDGHGRGIGLTGMRERAALMNGAIEIEGSGADGTTVLVSAPFLLRATDDDAVLT